MQHFVVQRQSAEPKLLYKKRQRTQCLANDQQQQRSFSSDCNDTVCTLPPAVPQLAETAPLTQPVEPLLLDELQDLGLNSLPQLTGGQTQRGQRGHTHTNKLVQ